MAYPTGVDFRHIGIAMGAQPINETSSTQQHPLGLVATAKDTTYGVGEFVYGVGVASTAAGDLCTYDSKNGDTARAVHGGATSTGSCGVAMSANTAGRYGWYQVSGSGPVASATVATDVPLYLTSTAGTVDDAVSGGDKVTGLVSRAASSAGFVTVQMDRPSIAAESTTAGTLKITLSAALEAADAIVVTGQVTDSAGTNISAATQVHVRTLAVTADKGDITVTSGTSKKVFSPTTGENVAWIETTASGGFAFSVANNAVEDTLVQVTADLALAATLKLTFT